MTTQSSSGAASAEFRHLRERTRQIFAVVAPEAYYERPISLRHPIAFYDGHLDAFNWNTLFRRTLGEPTFHEEFDRLFERGIDPADQAAALQRSVSAWPSYGAIQEYKARIGERFEHLLETMDFATAPGLLHEGRLLRLLLEHEAMHQETLLYMIHQLPYHLKRSPDGLRPPEDLPAPRPAMVAVPAGEAVLGARVGEFDFGWDNEFPQTTVAVSAFSIDVDNVTNGQFLAFMDAGGYQRRELWDDETWAWRVDKGIEHPFFWRREGSEWRYRGLFAEVSLPLAWPACVTHAEARAYARFCGKTLPTEAEWHRAAFGDRPDRRYPWGDEAPTSEHGNFDFSLWSPTRVGAYPKGASELGVNDLVGNGWEWTATPFAPFPGFTASEAYPRYSADFFDGQHFVMKGGSCFTDSRLLRRPFRNWFYWHYPYMYASFRCVAR